MPVSVPLLTGLLPVPVLGRHPAPTPLFPLASHGGPLWEPLCYAQIGGLSIATFITLGLVPVFYAIAVRDLKWIAWSSPAAEDVSVGSQLGQEV